MIETHDELEADRMAWIVAHDKLKTDNERLRKRCTNQRRELKRLNRQARPYWLGFETGLHFSDVARLRGIMNKTFGWQKVREAELAAVPTPADGVVNGN